MTKAERFRVLTMCLLLAPFLSASCAPRDFRAAQSAPYFVTARNSSRGTAVLGVSGLKPLAISHFQVSLARNPPAARPLGAFRVHVALSMPAMPMPPNVVSLREITPGAYVGEGTFTMAGDWTVTVIADGPAREHDVWVFPVAIK